MRRLVRQLKPVDGRAAKGPRSPAPRRLSGRPRGGTRPRSAASTELFQRPSLASGEKVTDREAARRGLEGSAVPLPNLGEIQRSFGRYDVSHVRAHVGGAARAANEQLEALAYAQGGRVAFRSNPTLHTAAHEAAHVVQQASGLQLDTDVGREGDAHERHADAVAEAVVRGRSAEPLLDRYGPRGAIGSARASAASGPLQYQREPLRDRVEDARFTDTGSYESFEAEVRRWVARRVLSRTGEAHRERALVPSGSLRRLYGTIRPGEPITLRAHFHSNGHSYRRLTWVIPGEDASAPADPQAPAGPEPEAAAPQETGPAAPEPAPAPPEPGQSEPPAQVEACTGWVAVGDKTTWQIIEPALREEGDVCEAWHQVKDARNSSEQNCCDLNYTAAEHYLWFRCEVGTGNWSYEYAVTVSATSAPLRLALEAAERAGIRAHRGGSCPSSPVSEDVRRWERRGAAHGQVDFERGRGRVQRGIQIPDPDPGG